jgi:hypothetical protein
MPELLENPVSMRVFEKDLPPFTLRLFAHFVNGKSPFCTGFVRFFLVFLSFSWIFAVFPDLSVHKTPEQSGSGHFGGNRNGA